MLTWINTRVNGGTIEESTASQSMEAEVNHWAAEDTARLSEVGHMLEETAEAAESRRVDKDTDRLGKLARVAREAEIIRLETAETSHLLANVAQQAALDSEIARLAVHEAAKQTGRLVMDAYLARVVEDEAACLAAEADTHWEAAEASCLAAEFARQAAEDVSPSRFVPQT